ncbi:MAG: ABC transporter permease [bacterium]|nr:ABC transporter permease [bacterium]
MRRMQVLVGRNITLFLKNKTNVLLCFFSIVIVIGLYVIFLRDFILQSVEETGLLLQYVKEFTDRLMVSGLLIVLNITTSFGIMQLNVSDAANGVQRDYLVAPVSKFQLQIGYWISSVLVSFFFTLLTMGGAELYFMASYENRFQLTAALKSIGTIFFSSCMNSGLLLLMVKFMKDTTSFSTFGNLYGMVCGFLAGTYLPYAMYPEKLKGILFYFPPMQLTSIIRQLYLSVFQEGGSKVGEQLYQVYGVTLIKEGTLITMRGQWSYLLLALAVVLLTVRIENREELL